MNRGNESERSGKGLVFEIREFSLFDGPGIRTTVFLKGCPLRCVWCHNPEGIAATPELLYSVRKCVHCGVCRSVCSLKEGELCKACGECARSCPVQARRLCGIYMTPEEVVNEALISRDAFESSGGGVTFSGGEPLLQPDFVVETAKILHGKEIHTAIETSGFAPLETYRRVIDSVDLVYQDLKHMDDKKHRTYVGASNVGILENVQWLKKAKKPFIIRVPLVPTVNDSIANLSALADFLLDADNMLGVELAPYHAASGGKYELLNRTPPMVFKEKQFGDEVLSPFRERGIRARLL